MKIAVIGVGAAGLIAIKYSEAEGYECEAFEQTEVIGGTWNYTDEVGLDKNGLPVQTSMYKNLRTNLPKEVMMFESFPYKESLKESYITQPEVLEYLNDFADKMNLRKHIRINTLVTYVEPIGNNKWDVELQDVISKKKVNKRFDAVIVANGKHSVPNMPNIPGLETFSGNCIHSHNYRSAEPYADKVVLIIGAGPSGIDISKQVIRVAKKVFCSFKETDFSVKLPKGSVKMPLVKAIEENIIYFEDGTMKEGMDEILLCTGYNIAYPFLSSKCGIIVEDNYVKYTYKELINAYYPTMAILCIPSAICPFPITEIQVRFFIATLTGKFLLPTRHQMLKDIEDFRKKRNVKARHFHKKIDNMEREYFDDLAKTANIKPVPLVVTELHNRVRRDRNYSDCFRIIDDEHFIQVA